MKDYIIRVQLDISRLCVWFVLVGAVLLLWNLAADHGMLNLAIFIFGVTLWIVVLIETINLMLPESDEPHDWQ